MTTPNKYKLENQEFKTMPIEARVNYKMLGAIAKHLTETQGIMFRSKSHLVATCVEIVYNVIAKDPGFVAPINNAEAAEFLVKSGVIDSNTAAVKHRHLDRFTNALTKDMLLVETGSVPSAVASVRLNEMMISGAILTDEDIAYFKSHGWTDQRLAIFFPEHRKVVEELDKANLEDKKKEMERVMKIAMESGIIVD